MIVVHYNSTCTYLVNFKLCGLKFQKLFNYRMSKTQFFFLKKKLLLIITEILFCIYWNRLTNNGKNCINICILCMHMYKNIN